MARSVDPPASEDAIAARNDYYAALVELEEAAAALRDAASRVVDAQQHAKAHVLEGKPVSDLPASIHLRDLRADIERAVERFHEARIATRVKTAVMASTEGTSLSEVARQFGFSRQYLSKLLSEAGVTPSGSPAP